MYALLLSPDGLPTTVSKNSRNYPDFIMSGYKEIDTGHKKDMEGQEEEMLKELYQN